ncbi:MAG: hypothetical protein EA423_12830 [Phycisphaerales bacterium]|nr:MAG: hypothetical protein EA423_12830 [Phycisphaerales bacterium]
MQKNPNASGGVIRRRLGYYALGVAIGFLVLGMIMTTRQRMHQAQADREADAGRTVPTPGTPIGRDPRESNRDTPPAEPSGGS